MHKNNSLLLRFSPGSDFLFYELVECTATVCNPLRRTVRAATMRSVINNYKPLMMLFRELVDDSTDSELRAKLMGILAKMKDYNFLFGEFLYKKYWQL